MKPYQKRMALALLAGSIGVACSAAWLAAAWAQQAAPLPAPVVGEPKPQPPATPRCDVDLRITAQLKDVLSNVLLLAEHKPESEVKAFLKDAVRRSATSDDLLKAAAEHFKIDRKRLAASVEHRRHINCNHAAIPGFAAPEPAPDAGRKAIAGVAEPKPQPPANPRCKADLKNAGWLKDVLSNALVRAEHKPESDVAPFLKDAETRFATGDDLLKAAAEHFKIDPKRMAALAEQWGHIHCRHAMLPGSAAPDRAPLLDTVPVSVFAADVTLHVVFHEIGHAVIREFDLMVLGNEETMADAFATHLLTEHFPEHAASAISARVRSLMIEAGEEPRDQWAVRGEHDNDARRAFQIAALAIAADKQKYAGVAQIVGMSKEDIDKARDYGSDIHRDWRRTLSPLMMPAGKASKLAHFRADEATRAFADAGKPGLASTITHALQRFNWPSRVTVDFVWGPGTAGWNRSKRTVTVKSEYLERFVAQGVKAKAQVAPR